MQNDESEAISQHFFQKISLGVLLFLCSCLRGFTVLQCNHNQYCYSAAQHPVKEVLE